MSNSALIEIGVEELPVGCQHIFYSQGAENLQRLLEKYRLDFKEVLVEATPRRLAFFIQDLGPKQREERTVILGPAYDKAYESEDKPSPALEGFLKAQRASLRDVVIKENPRGRYVAVEKVQKGESLTKLLPKIVSELLASFSFPKMMRWEKTGFRFPRPLRWLVVLYGSKLISFSLAGIRTGRLSYGHRFLGSPTFSIPKADWSDYRKRLRSHHVILSRAEREEMIKKGLIRKFHQKDFDPDLVREAAQLVEEPFLIQGKFSGTYRDLPEEVLATCMKKYQKIFSCRDERGNLMNRFVAVMNGRRGGVGQIQHDYENVLESRLRDAQYFYEEDTKEPLEKKVVRLKELVFLGRLGNMEERVKRLEALAGHLAHLSGHAELEKSLKRIAFLSKADLVTQMVGEFPELQGIMGREYAREAGEPAEVARAIGEQYLPRNLAEDSASLSKRISLLGALFGIADRLDLLVGAFAIRLNPSGSEDPYALRRAGGILVKLIGGFGFQFLLRKLIEESYSGFKVKLDLSLEELTTKLIEFLKERMIFELQVKAGTRPYEILLGVMKSSFEELNDVFKRFGILSELSAKQPQVFFKTSKVVERTSNILKGVKGDLHSVNPSLFQEPLEKELFGLLEKRGPELRDSIKKRDYQSATRLYGEVFFDPLHHFFDRVMVNVEDDSVRKNRQAMMKEINNLYTEKVADLSFLTQVKE